MATSKKAATTTATANLPAGFEEQATGHEGWVAFEKGKPIVGILVGYEARHDGDGYQFLLKLTAPATIKTGPDETREGQAGEVVAMNETAQLAKVLRQWVNPIGGGPVEVYVVPLEKKKAKAAGRTFWDFKIGIAKKGARPGKPPVTEPVESEDDFDF